jgi:hypothetical protein
MKLGGPQNQPGSFGEERKKTLASLGIQTPGLSIPQPSYYVY